MGAVSERLRHPFFVRDFFVYVVFSLETVTKKYKMQILYNKGKRNREISRMILPNLYDFKNSRRFRSLTCG